MFFRRRRERKRAEEERAREVIDQMREEQRELERKLARRQERFEQRSREREVFGDSAEKAAKYDDIAKRLFELVVELADGADLPSDGRAAQITEEIKRTGVQLDADGGLDLMLVVCGRVTELGHAAAAKARRDTSAVTYGSHQHITSLDSAGRILEEEWKWIGQWR